MATANISTNLAGALTSRPATCNGAGSSGSSGPALAFNISDSAAANASSTFTTVDSALAFTPLALPANLRARLLYIRILTTAKMTLRLTYEVTGLVVEPVIGLWVKQFPADDRVSLIELQGQGDLEWYAAGGIV